MARRRGQQRQPSGVIAGMHAPTLDGSGWSQWLIDDATGQLRTRLASSHTASQLNLGYLIHQGTQGIAVVLDPNFYGHDGLYEELLDYELPGRYDTDKLFHGEPIRL